MQTLEQLKARAESAAIEGLSIEGNALVVDRAWLLPMARFVRDDAALRLDFLTSLCAVDWLKGAGLPPVAGATEGGGYLEIVYHLYSVALRHGPLTLKCRTANRGDDARVPSVTLIWRGAEFQEREAFDLYGVVFDGHPDLRRILMWDEFTDFPMRKDYQPPDDYEWEPTPHGSILERVKARNTP